MPKAEEAVSVDDIVDEDMFSVGDDTEEEVTVDLSGDVEDLEDEVEELVDGDVDGDEVEETQPKQKKKRGRPKGSKNQKTKAKEVVEEETSKEEPEEDTQLIHDKIGSKIFDADLNVLSTGLITDRSKADYSKAEISGLMDSLRAQGQIQPIVLRARKKASKGKKYDVLCGKRRIYAAGKLGWSTLKAVSISDLEDSDAKIIALSENHHRRNVDPVFQAKMFEDLLSNGAYDNQSELADELGVSQSFISKSLRLTELDKDVQEEVSEGKLPASVASAAVKTRKKKGEKVPTTKTQVAEEIAKTKRVPLSKKFLIPEGETKPDPNVNFTLTKNSVILHVQIGNNSLKKNGILASVRESLGNIGEDRILRAIQSTKKANF